MKLAVTAVALVLAVRAARARRTIGIRSSQRQKKKLR